jgi:hypothetical protein
MHGLWESTIGLVLATWLASIFANDKESAAAIFVTRDAPSLSSTTDACFCRQRKQGSPCSMCQWRRVLASLKLGKHKLWYCDFSCLEAREANVIVDCQLRCPVAQTVHIKHIQHPSACEACG